MNAAWTMTPKILINQLLARFGYRMSKVFSSP
jgi:hypothetical protein